MVGPSVKVTAILQALAAQVRRGTLPSGPRGLAVEARRGTMPELAVEDVEEEEDEDGR